MEAWLNKETGAVESICCRSGSTSPGSWRMSALQQINLVWSKGHPLMERKTKIKHSHSTMRRYGATRGRESSCNIPLCHLCCTDLYGPLLLFPPTGKLQRLKGRWQAWAVMKRVTAQPLPAAWSRALSTQWWVPPVSVSSCNTSSCPDP